MAAPGNAIIGTMSTQTAETLQSAGSETEPTSQMVEIAAAWHVQLHAKHVSEDKLAEFEQWLDAHPAHALAYRRLEDFWQRLSKLEPTPALQALEKALDTKHRRRRNLPSKSLTLGLALIAAGWLGTSTEMAQHLMADYNTAVGERRVIELTDNSRITLNTYSAIDVDFSPDRRHITLRSGEILVEVASDASRPFIVETAQGTARALGTKYVVRRDADTTRVGVIESVVEACPNKSFFSDIPTQCVRLQAEQGTSMTTDHIGQPQPIDTLSLTAWSDGMISVDNQPLADVLTELERYRRGNIHFDTAELAGLRVSGVFPISDSDRTLQMLADILPINVSRYTPLLVIVKPRQPAD